MFGALPKTESSTVANITLTTSTVAEILVCDNPADSRPFWEAIQSHGHRLVYSKVALPISSEMRCCLSNSDIVLLDVTRASAEILKTFEHLHAANATLNVGPRLLCFSTAHRNPGFVMALKKWGAQYVRVDGVTMLCEAVNLLSAEIKDIERNGPFFEVIHRFSQGSCAPGEEIAAVFLLHDGDSFQLPLGLAQRFVFEFVAQHRRLAQDAQQIFSGLSRDWFYRDHAANNGYRQLKKIRRPAVKVLIQRIREAMATVFTRANLRLDPYDVLRSYPVEGSKRVLYKLVADVRWRHSQP